MDSPCEVLGLKTFAWGPEGCTKTRLGHLSCDLHTMPCLSRTAGFGRDCGKPGGKMSSAQPKIPCPNLSWPGEGENAFLPLHIQLPPPPPHPGGATVQVTVQSTSPCKWCKMLESASQWAIDPDCVAMCPLRFLLRLHLNALMRRTYATNTFVDFWECSTGQATASWRGRAHCARHRAPLGT